jgi:putative membrane protein
MGDVSWHALRFGARLVVRRKLDLTVDGMKHLPAGGPVILAARHYHHLHDGCAVIAAIPRPVHILVGLDWVANPLGRRAMDMACAAARWPVVLRRKEPEAGLRTEEMRALRQSMRESLDLLDEGRILLMFPEGYPTVDPGFTPKTDADEFLTFQPGVVRLASAARARGIHAPIVPVGFEYTPGERWTVRMAFGAPMFVEGRNEEANVLEQLNRQVRELSGFGAG